MWHIRISKRNLTNKQRDYIADLTDAEAHSTIEPYYFTLHEILESRHFCEIIIEGSRKALKNLCAMFRDNFNGTITYRVLP